VSVGLESNSPDGYKIDGFSAVFVTSISTIVSWLAFGDTSKRIGVLSSALIDVTGDTSACSIP